MEVPDSAHTKSPKSHKRNHVLSFASSKAMRGNVMWWFLRLPLRECSLWQCISQFLQIHVVNFCTFIEKCYKIVWKCTFWGRLRVKCQNWDYQKDLTVSTVFNQKVEFLDCYEELIIMLFKKLNFISKNTHQMWLLLLIKPFSICFLQRKW